MDDSQGGQSQQNKSFNLYRERTGCGPALNGKKADADALHQPGLSGGTRIKAIHWFSVRALNGVLGAPLIISVR